MQIDDRIHGQLISVRIHNNGVKEMKEPLAEFSAKPGDKFIVYSKKGRNSFGVAVETKKWLRTWTTSSQTCH